MILHNIKDVEKARSNTSMTSLVYWPKEREKELVNALLDIREISKSGSYEMATVDEVLGNLGYKY